jgi:hypothetical protein
VERMSQPIASAVVGAPVAGAHDTSASANRQSAMDHVISANHCRAMGKHYADSNDPRHSHLSTVWYRLAAMADTVAVGRLQLAANHDEAASNANARAIES